MNLVLLDPSEIRADDPVLLAGPRATHLLQVLRVAPGDDVRVGVVDGPIGTATVTAIHEGQVTLACRFDSGLPPVPAVDLLLALPRPKVLRRLWAQLAAIGVGRIMLTNAARVERHYFDTHVLTPACYRPLLIEGLQQARDTRLPVVSVHKRFKVLVEDELDGLAGDTRRLVAHPGRTAAVTALVRERAQPRVLLAIGPEGGWNDFEMGLLEVHGFSRVDMGSRTLRSDTATIALLTLVHDALR